MTTVTTVRTPTAKGTAFDPGRTHSRGETLG
jgi:hypothetical protein